jgi:hypothetical protein
VTAITGGAAHSGKHGAIEVLDETEGRFMNVKQGLFTGVLATAIVASVAFLPVNAEVKETRAQPARVAGKVAQVPVSKQPAPQTAGDLTYN